MKLIPTSMTRSVARHILVVQKNSPKLLFGVGIVGIVGSTVLACRATMKLAETLDEFKHEVDMTKDINLTHTIEPIDQRKNLARIYATNTLKLGKLYAPAIVVGGASIAALTGSHVVLTRRNASLTAAYAAVFSAFDAYRERVRQELGDEKERDIRHAITLEKTKVNDRIVQMRKTDPNKWSMYARFFDAAGSTEWQKDAESNRAFVQCQQNYLNHMLNIRGHVFLNEAYDRLGIDRSQAGQSVGWILDDSGRHQGDNYISFGIFEESSSGFVNGWEPNVLLDFNVDGVIYDKI